MEHKPMEIINRKDGRNKVKVKSKLFLILFIFITQVKAAGDTVTHVFIAGTTINANEVNENFQELADRIATITNANNPTAYDYRDYIPATTLSQLKYTVDVDSSGKFGGHDTEIHALSFTGDTLLLTRQRIAGGESGTATKCHKLTLISNANSFDLTKREHFSTDCNTLSTSYTLKAGIPVLETAMTKGILYGGGFEASVLASDSTTPSNFYGNDVSTLMGTEDVTLTVNGATVTYPACLKIFRKRQFSGWGGDYQRTVWYCAGIGMTKMIETRDYGGLIASRKRELYAIN